MSERVEEEVVVSQAVGALLEPGGVRFRVWAPAHERVEVVLFEGEEPVTSHLLKREPGGYHAFFLPEVGAGTRYKFRVDGEGPFPDPASRAQPLGVHGPSEVVDQAFDWTDGEWRGLPLDELIIYELHVGTATAEGTFESLVERLDEIKELGVTAIELMPVADFPGERNWGYDGVSLWAPSRAYGRPKALKRLVNAAHERGLAVLLDVVYNHLGPDGNYLGVYSDYYYNQERHTPWGAALNFDGPHSAPVRDFFLANSLYWLREFHFDGLRLDAIHEILDESERYLLAELVERVREHIPADRHIVLTAEDERNERALVLPQRAGGVGLDAVWA
ncbi:MAG: alpha-amylase family glycosyl hydrolase, partial [Chloroflexota bacterium]|nr:alpha-amylase family glycosyl hydrolase [Chloroflexota bacterium]